MPFEGNAQIRKVIADYHKSVEEQENMVESLAVLLAEGDNQDYFKLTILGQAQYLVRAENLLESKLAEG